jgi:hypothetical protein
MNKQHIVTRYLVNATREDIPLELFEKILYILLTMTKLKPLERTKLCNQLYDDLKLGE